MVGVAPEAMVAMMRAGTGDTCATKCTFSREAIRTGVERAMSARAAVVNISLGVGRLICRGWAAGIHASPAPASR